MSMYRAQLAVVFLMILAQDSPAWWHPLGLKANVSSIGYTMGWYFVMTADGLYRTDDPLSVKGWERIGSTRHMVSPFVAIGRHLFMRTLSGYMASTDLGVTWTSTTPFPTDTPGDQFFSSDRYLFILQRTELHRSSDLGATWERIDLTPYHGVVYRRMFTMLPSGTGYAQGTDYSIWVTTDHGVHWIETKGPSLYGFGHDLWASRTGILYGYERPNNGNDSFFNKPYLGVSHDGGREFSSVYSAEQTIGAHAFADAGNTVLIAATEFGWSFQLGDWTRDGVVRSKSADFWGRTWEYVGSPFDHTNPQAMVTQGGCVFANSADNTIYVYQFTKTVTEAEDVEDTAYECSPIIRRDLEHAMILNPCEPIQINVFDLLGRRINVHTVPTGSAQLPIAVDQFIRIVRGAE